MRNLQGGLVGSTPGSQARYGGINSRPSQVQRMYALIYVNPLPDEHSVGHKSMIRIG